MLGRRKRKKIKEGRRKEAHRDGIQNSKSGSQEKMTPTKTEQSLEHTSL